MSCTKYNDNTAPQLKTAQVYTIVEGDVTKSMNPKITFEVSDSTFYDTKGFNYHCNSYSYSSSSTILPVSGNVIAFAPQEKLLKNPAYLNFDFKDNESVLTLKAFKIKYSISTIDNSLYYNIADTSKWVQVNNLQFNSIQKNFRFPVGDFGHVYFMADKP